MSTLQYDKFLLFGDSITEFAFNTAFQEAQNFETNTPVHQQFSLGAALTNKYTRKLDIVQRGFSGFNSRWALKVLPQILSIENQQSGNGTGRIKMATVFFGSNDSCLGGHQKVEIKEYKENTIKLVRMLQDAKIKTILISPALFNAELWDPSKKEEVDSGYVRTNENFAKYAQACEEVGRELDVPVINLNTEFIKYAKENLNDDWTPMLCDGLHFSGHGYKCLYDVLLECIKNNYSEYHPDNLKYKLPNWRSIKDDASNLEF
ncbi:related to Isoamyl acetate-hydrolyzing esterase [Saccharomycodes ludwigii]|uniref:Related to Isoamyl acetate-hydrolyzing esterase n=1 Tax=Saccharomycodes ludwigii TaxID=36035 RepID=A0A376BAU7_9ASCO|nr:hypothetical protein SCDLUD_003230 [Saccharomycodes ludwigii]KAH3900258.1 hypothetical protein SCDLUD_003230 [Saccharomycodes ludwigii]SSD61792.1 related to Isoamyl acetate-hydrolyzing esterase [Saccharomycodes ludwigii]